MVVTTDKKENARRHLLIYINGIGKPGTLAAGFPA
jgi:hypothetical protein